MLGLHIARPGEWRIFSAVYWGCFTWLHVAQVPNFCNEAAWIVLVPHSRSTSKEQRLTLHWTGCQAEGYLSFLHMQVSAPNLSRGSCDLILLR